MEKNYRCRACGMPISMGKYCSELCYKALIARQARDWIRSRQHD